MALIEPLKKIQGSKSELLRGQRLQAIRQELKDATGVLDELIALCDQTIVAYNTRADLHVKALLDVVDAHMGACEVCLKDALGDAFESGGGAWCRLNLYKYEHLTTCLVSNWWPQFGQAILARKVMGEKFASQREIVDWLRPRFEKTIEERLREIAGSHERREGMRRSGSYLVWPALYEWEDIHQHRTDLINVEAQDIASTIRNYFQLGDLDDALEDGGYLAAQVNTELAGETREKTSEAREMAVCLLDAHPLQLANPRK